MKSRLATCFGLVLIGCHSSGTGGGSVTNTTDACNPPLCSSGCGAGTVCVNASPSLSPVCEPDCSGGQTCPSGYECKLTNQGFCHTQSDCVSGTCNLADGSMLGQCELSLCVPTSTPTCGEGSYRCKDIEWQIQQVAQSDLYVCNANRQNNVCADPVPAGPPIDYHEACAYANTVCGGCFELCGGGPGDAGPQDGGVEAAAELPVGSSCIPGWEFCSTYSASSERGAWVDTSAQCQSGICLLDHFRGRVSCPMGNTNGGSHYAGADVECVLPGADGTSTVQSEVPPQCAERKDAAYCTCQCSGDNPIGGYCQCPVGYSCKTMSRLRDDGLHYTTQCMTQRGFCFRDSLAWEDGKSCSQSCDTQPDHCGYAQNSVPLASGANKPATLPTMGTATSQRVELESSPCVDFTIPSGLNCTIFEVVPGAAPSCPACMDGRTTMSCLSQYVLTASGLEPDGSCACEIQSASSACATDVSLPSSDQGWCCLDAATSPSELLGTCSVGAIRLANMQVNTAAHYYFLCQKERKTCE